jgi:surface protein
MKQIVNYINERLHITSKSFYTCKPKTKDELREIIIQRIKEDGPECELNDIDVSKITDMSWLFTGCENFNGDISRWNVSKVRNMENMFFACNKFNCDISKWDVSNVTNMWGMFWGCKIFDCDLSNWNISNVESMDGAFYDCPTKPKWYKGK